MAMANFNQIQLPVSGSHLDPTGNPPRFYGYIHESFTEFLSKFKLYALRLNLDSDQKMQILPSYLMGPAASIYASLPDYEKTPTAAATATGTPGTGTYVPAHGDTNFNTLAEALAQYFNTTEHKTYFQRLVMKRKQFPNESFSDFVIDVIRMFDIAYADMTANDDTALIRQQQLLSIIRTNADHEICAFLLVKDPHSVQEAVTMVARYQLYKPDRETLKADKTKLLNRLDKLIDAIQLEDNETNATPSAKFPHHTNTMYAPQSLNHHEQHYNQEEEKVINDHLMMFGQELEEQKHTLINQQKQLASLDSILKSHKKKVTWQDQQEPSETDERLPEDPHDYTDRDSLSYWRDPMSEDRASEIGHEDRYYRHENNKNSKKRLRCESDNDYEYNQNYHDNDQLSHAGYEMNEHKTGYANCHSQSSPFNQHPPSTFAIHTGLTNTNLHYPGTVIEGYYQPGIPQQMTNAPLVYLQAHSAQEVAKNPAQSKVFQVTEEKVFHAEKYPMQSDFWPAKRLGHAYSFSSLNSEEEDETSKSSLISPKPSCNMIEANNWKTSIEPQLQGALAMLVRDKLGKNSLTSSYQIPLQVSDANVWSLYNHRKTNRTEKLLWKGAKVAHLDRSSSIHRENHYINQHDNDRAIGSQRYFHSAAKGVSRVNFNRFLPSKAETKKSIYNNILLTPTLVCNMIQASSKPMPVKEQITEQISFSSHQVSQLLDQIKSINDQSHLSRKMVPSAWICLERAEKELEKLQRNSAVFIDLVFNLQQLMITLSCRPRIHPRNVKKLRQLQQKLRPPISPLSQPLTHEAESASKTDCSAPSQLNCVPSLNSSSLMAVSLPLRRKNIYVVYNKARARGFNGYLQKAYERQEYSIAQQKNENVQKNKDKKMIPAEKVVAPQEEGAKKDIKEANIGLKATAQGKRENKKKITKTCYNIHNNSTAHVGQKSAQGGPLGQWFSPISSYKNSDLVALVNEKQVCPLSSEIQNEKHLYHLLQFGKADEPKPESGITVSLLQQGEAQLQVHRREPTTLANVRNLTSDASTTKGVKSVSNQICQPPVVVKIESVQKEKTKDANNQLKQTTKTSLVEGQYKTTKLPTTFKIRSNTSDLKAGQKSASVS